MKQVSTHPMVISSDSRSHSGIDRDIHRVNKFSLLIPIHFSLSYRQDQMKVVKHLALHQR